MRKQTGIKGRRREREREREGENLKQNLTPGSIPGPWDHVLSQNQESDVQLTSHTGILRCIFVICIALENRVHVISIV